MSSAALEVDEQGASVCTCASASGDTRSGTSKAAIVTAAANHSQQRYRSGELCNQVQHVVGSRLISSSPDRDPHALRHNSSETIFKVTICVKVPRSIGKVTNCGAAS
eukprot:6053975-Pleurochrysis_carterae.AAC.4